MGEGRQQNWRDKWTSHTGQMEIKMEKKEKGDEIDEEQNKNEEKRREEEEEEEEEKKRNCR